MSDHENQSHQRVRPSTPADHEPPAEASEVSDQATPNKVDLGLVMAMYQVLATRRQGYDILMWQVPALSLTAQAFLFTTALGSDSRAGRVISASLAFVLSIISLQLMAKHRYNEQVDTRLLEGLEEALEKNWRLTKALDLPSTYIPHGSVQQRAKAAQHLAASNPHMKVVKSNWFVRRSSFRLWLAGLALFGVAALAIIVSTVLNIGLLP